MQITPNFNKIEFDSNDGSEMPADVLQNVKEVARCLQILRDEIGKPIRINSGYRSPRHNKRVGGSPNSQHLLGKAVDIVVKDLPPVQVAEILEELIAEGTIPEGGIGIYPGFTHYDIRGTRARWDYR